MLQVLLLICATVFPAQSYLNSTILFPFHPNKYDIRFVPVRKSINSFIPPSGIQNGLGWNHQQQLLLNHPWYTSRYE